MNYPREFKDRVKATFPHSGGIHQWLEVGSELVGRQLDDSRVEIDPGQILYLLDTDNHDELRRIIYRQIEIRQLYLEWSRLYHEQRFNS